MKIEKFIIHLFDSRVEPAISIGIAVPMAAKFLAAKVLPDGIYAFYEVPELTISDTRVERFSIPSKKPIPNNFTFVELLDVFFQNDEGEQGVIIYPIYKQVN